MKLVVVILSGADTENVIHKLLEADFRFTRLSSSGGFLRRGNTTLLMGTPDERVDLAIETMRAAAETSADTNHRGAMIFVLDVNRFEQL
ncbi:MAG TPA: cyclic-di-AMP receptor [Anaerolineales bacterium]|nr:cyclic-di-AMP receptor [Anaerolineales bacterium]